MSCVKRGVRTLLACMAIMIFSGHSFSLCGGEISGGGTSHSTEAENTFPFSRSQDESVDYESPSSSFFTIFVSDEKSDGEEFLYFSKAKKVFSTLENIAERFNLNSCRLLMVLHAAGMSGERDQDQATLQTYFQDLMRTARLCEKHHLAHLEKSLPSFPSALVLAPEFLLQLREKVPNSMDLIAREMPVNDSLLNALHCEPEANDLLLGVQEGRAQVIPQFENSLVGLIQATSWVLRRLSSHLHFGWAIPASIREEEEARRLAFDWSPSQAGEKSYQLVMNLIKQWKLCDTEWAPSFLAFLYPHLTDSLEKLSDKRIEDLITLDRIWEYMGEIVQESGLPVLIVDAATYDFPPSITISSPSEKDQMSVRSSSYVYFPLHEDQIFSEVNCFFDEVEAPEPQ